MSLLTFLDFCLLQTCIVIILSLSDVLTDSSSAHSLPFSLYKSLHISYFSLNIRGITLYVEEMVPIFLSYFYLLQDLTLSLIYYEETWSLPPLFNVMSWKHVTNYCLHLLPKLHQRNRIEKTVTIMYVCSFKT